MCEDFIGEGILLTTTLLNQGYQRTKAVSTHKKFKGRHHDLVNSYYVAVSRLTAKP